MIAASAWRGLLGAGLWLALVAPLCAVDRAALDEAYRGELSALAEKCDSLSLKAEAEETRAWYVKRLPDRQYIFVPLSRLEADADKSELHQKWREKFLSLRRAQAEKLVALSDAYAQAEQPALADQALHEALREDPDHTKAREILGYRKADGAWRKPSAAVGVVKAKLAHALVSEFKPGTYWRVTTQHFQIATNAGPQAAEAFGEELETLYVVWRQVFQPGTVAPKLKKPYDVVLFKNRESYVANLSPSEPRIAATQGYYADKRSTAFLYIGDARSLATCRHEVTHQLFQESPGAGADVGAERDFWIVEGIALYMESLRTFERAGKVDYVTLGGWDPDRLQFARHHVFNGQYQLPLEKLAAFSRDNLQKDKDIKRLYSQSAGLAHYLMDGQNGKHRAALADYIARVYAGEKGDDAIERLTGIATADHDLDYKDYLKVTNEDIKAIEYPASLRNLCLGYQPITDEGIKKLSTCENLEWLDLAKTGITDDGVAALASLRKLDQLNLEQTAIGDAGLAHLAKQTQLRELDLSHTQITDAGLAKLKDLVNLEVLWLTGDAVTDASAPTLTRFKKLKTLDLAGTKLTPAAIQRIRSALPSLNPEP